MRGTTIAMKLRDNSQRIARHWRAACVAAYAEDGYDVAFTCVANPSADAQGGTYKVEITNPFEVARAVFRAGRRAGNMKNLS